MKRNTAPKRQTLLQGAAVLLGALAVVKVLGALFKIPLSWILTPVGSAYFGSAYALYFPIYSLAVAGFPAAVARMVSARAASGRLRSVRALRGVCVRLFFLLGLLAFGAMVLLSFPYARLTAREAPETVLPALWALAPAAFFCSLLSVYRGLYEGLSNMTPTAVSQILEAACKLVFGLGLSYGGMALALREYAASGTVWGVPQPSASYARLSALPACAGGAVFGVTIGGAVGLLYLVYYYRRHREGFPPARLQAAPPPESARTLRRELLRTAAPMALGSLAVNLSTLVDAAVLNGRLSDLMETAPGALLAAFAGRIPEEVVRSHTVPAFLYGCYTNANTLFMLLPAAAQALAMSALPAVTTAWVRGQKPALARCIRHVLRLSAVAVLPVGLGMSCFAQPICEVLFGPRNAPDLCAQVLRILGIAAVFSALSTPVQSMLQAVGRADVPVKLLFFGLLLKAALTYTLAGMPQWNLCGAAVSTLVCYTALFFASLIFLLHVAKLKMPFFSLFGKPLLAAAVCVLTALLLWKALPENLAELPRLMLCILLAGTLYVLALSLLGVVHKSDWRRLRASQKF